MNSIASSVLPLEHLIHAVLPQHHYHIYQSNISVFLQASKQGETIIKVTIKEFTNYTT